MEQQVTYKFTEQECWHLATVGRNVPKPRAVKCTGLAPQWRALVSSGLDAPRWIAGSDKSHRSAVFHEDNGWRFTTTP